MAASGSCVSPPCAGPGHEPALPGLHGPARVERRASALARRARPGDIAVIDHLDLDGSSARLLVDAGVAAVVNAAPSISGRYPNLGPQLLVQAGVPVLDRVGPEVIRLLDDGDRLRLDGDALYRGEDADLPRRPADRRVGRRWRWRRPGPASVPSCRRSRTPPPSTCAGSATCCSTAPVRRHVGTPIEGRAVVVVTRGKGSERDLRGPAPWLRATEPVLVGVDEGADALLAAGLRPHLVVGDPTLVSDDVLDCGAELVVRADRDGTAARAAPRRAGRPASRRSSRCPASSEDAALLLVDAHQPALIVGVGWHPTLAEFVDCGRADMPSAFLTRLPAR